ncbi:MAG: hypothetical protein DRP71_04240 [Verrucomicrobia bacterium]|nr:MAG: hypothetical protein DRP71_04240 [Verrucomicrobiota bacterium]
MPGIGVDMEGAIQQAPQPIRHSNSGFMIGSSMLRRVRRSPATDRNRPRRSQSIGFRYPPPPWAVPPGSRPIGGRRETPSGRPAPPKSPGLPVPSGRNET